MGTMAQTVGVVAAVASMAALAAQPTWRGGLLATLARWTGYHAPGGLWRIAAIFLALVNLKNLPFVWHIRIFRALIYQLYLQPTAIPPHALFQPVITSSRTTLLETDYNLHKSNSTYFSDMDISRSALFSAIMRNAILKSKTRAAGATQGTKGTHMIALGGISCLFKKEILPYKKYEMWTRLLCWDRKWFYLVTHLVKPGVAKPKTWTLQPWKKASSSSSRSGSSAEGVDKEKLKGAVFATGIAKYVIKRGRLTIPPEQALVDAGMVPVKPEDWVYQGEEEDGKDDADAIETSTLPSPIQPEEWNWDVIERERRRGLLVAERFAGLDGMHGYFDGGEGGVLGEYADLLW